jgi:hypothetical protein
MANDDRPDDQRPSPLTDERVEKISERLSEELIDSQGHHPDVAAVRPVVEESAAELADAPIQEFVPLLAEHRARDALHDAGLHLDPTAVPDVDEVDDDEDRDRS